MACSYSNRKYDRRAIFIIRLFENVYTETLILLSEVARSSLWVESVAHVSDLCLTNRRPCFWFVAEKSISDPGNVIFYQLVSSLIYKVKGIAVNIRKLLAFNRYAERRFNINSRLSLGGHFGVRGE